MSGFLPPLPLSVGSQVPGLTKGDLLDASATNTMGRIAAVAMGQVLASQGAGAEPAWSPNLNVTGSIQCGAGGLLSGGPASIVGGALVTERLNWGQSASVGSAASIALGAGNSAEITAAAAISLMASAGWADGAEVSLVCSGGCSFVHNAAPSAGLLPFRLAGGIAFVTVANNVLNLRIMTIGGVRAWWETSRSLTT